MDDLAAQSEIVPQDLQAERKFMDKLAAQDAASSPADMQKDTNMDDLATQSVQVRPEDLQQDVSLLRENFRLAAEKTLSLSDAADYPRLLNTLANVAGKLAQLVRVQIELQGAQGLGTQGLGSQGRSPSDEFKVSPPKCSPKSSARLPTCR